MEEVVHPTWERQGNVSQESHPQTLPQPTWPGPSTETQPEITNRGLTREELYDPVCILESHSYSTAEDGLEQNKTKWKARFLRKLLQ